MMFAAALIDEAVLASKLPETIVTVVATELPKTVGAVIATELPKTVGAVIAVTKLPKTIGATVPVEFDDDHVLFIISSSESYSFISCS